MKSSQATDVVVVGAGILGASTAFHLAEKGCDVTVLESQVPNRQGSGTTAGNLHIQGTHTQRPGTDLHFDNLRLMPLQKAASDMWDEVPGKVDADIELRRNGGFMVAETDEQVDELRTKAFHEMKAGIVTELLEGEDLSSSAPFLSRSVQAATWCEADGYVNPLKVTPAWLSAARRLGVRVHSNVPVMSAKRLGATWEVVSRTQSWIAPIVILVPGAILGEVALKFGAVLNVTPAALQMHLTVRSPTIMTHLVQHIGEGLSVKQVKSGQVMIGGGWPALGRPGPGGRGRVRLASIAGNVARALSVLPELSKLRLLRTWSGPLAVTPDELPVVGLLPGTDSVLVAGGPYSLTLAPLWGHTLAALAWGEEPPVSLEGLGPDRLRAGVA